MLVCVCDVLSQAVAFMCCEYIFMYYYIPDNGPDKPMHA